MTRPVRGPSNKRFGLRPWPLAPSLHFLLLAWTRHYYDPRTCLPMSPTPYQPRAWYDSQTQLEALRIQILPPQPPALPSPLVLPKPPPTWHRGHVHAKPYTSLHCACRSRSPQCSGTYDVVTSVPGGRSCSARNTTCVLQPLLLPPPLLLLLHPPAPPVPPLPLALLPPWQEADGDDDGGKGASNESYRATLGRHSWLISAAWAYSALPRRCRSPSCASSSPPPPPAAGCEPPAPAPHPVLLPAAPAPSLAASACRRVASTPYELSCSLRSSAAASAWLKHSPAAAVPGPADGRGTG